MKYHNKLITILLSLIIIASFLLSVISAADESSKCQDLDRQMGVLVQQESRRCDVNSSTYDPDICDNIKTQIDELNAEACEEGCSWADCVDPCPGTNLFIVDDLGQRYRVDGSPYYVSQFIMNSGDIGFCIEPGETFDPCAEYDTSGVLSYGEDTLREIALAVYAYKQSPSIDHFVAAQIRIWELMGMPRTVNGGDKYAYGWADLEKMIEDATAPNIHRVKMEEELIMMDLNDEYINSDLNEELHENYKIDSTAGLTAEINNNDAEGELNRIYPLTKEVVIEPIEKSIGGNINGGDIYFAPFINSQTLFSFNGSIDATHFYYGDEFETQTKTGNLVIDKVDEWGDSVDNGIAFRVWFAKEDPNGTAIDSSGTKWSKYSGNGEFPGGLFYQEDGTDTFYTTGSKVYIDDLPSGGVFDDGTPIGTYIVQEVSTTNPYVLNGDEFVVNIEYNRTSHVSIINDKRIVELEILKRDLGEPGEMSDTEVFLNDSTFEIYDVSDYFGLSIDTNDGKNPKVNNYFLKLNKSVNLNEFLSSDTIVSSISNPTFKIKNPHCNTATLEGSILTAHKTDVLYIDVLDGEEVKTTITIYLILDDDSIYSGDSFILSGIAQFRGNTGQRYTQLVDPTRHDGHYLPLANEVLTLYYDEALTQAYMNYTSDEFGMIDFSNPTTPDVQGTDDGDGIYYYQKVASYRDNVPSDGYYITASITQEELDSGFKDEKGHVLAEYLKHTRTYLVCESKTPDNFDIPNNENYIVSGDGEVNNGVATQNACVIYNTNQYASGNNHLEITRDNRKGRGDFEFTKLNEWLENDGTGTKFKIYHALLEDNGLSYEENYKNIVYDEYGRPELGKLVKNPVTGEDYFTVDENGNINIYNYLFFGFYVLEEYDETNPFNPTDERVLFEIKHSKLTEKSFVNENRTVEFDVFKEDGEEEFRKLNDAEFTIYDISDTLDTDMLPTDLGLLGDYDYGETIDPGMTLSPYQAEYIYFLKLNQTIDLYDFLILNDPYNILAGYVGDKPLKYNLSHNATGVVDVDGRFTATKTGFVDIEVVGGSYNLYGTAGPKTVYENTYFDPYRDLEFYEDAEMKIPVNIESIEYKYVPKTIIDKETGEEIIDPDDTFNPDDNNYVFNTKIPGEYTLHYTLISKDHVKYEFDRTITVIEDNRHVCKINPDTNTWYWADTKESCDDEDPGFSVDYSYPEVVPLIVTNYEDKEDWIGEKLLNVRIYTISEDDKITSELPTDVIDGLAVFRGKTGHRYIQLVDHANHNLPLANKEVITYYDPGLQYPYKKYVSDEFGMIDVTNPDEGELLSGGPVIKQDGNGYYYVQAQPKSEFSCELDTYTYDEEKGLCVNNENPEDTLKAKETITYEEVKVYLENYEPIDPEMSVEHEPTVLYYLDRTIEHYDGTKEDIIKEVPLYQDEGKIEVDYLKHSRTYLVCETELPEGYDFPEGQNACFILKTGGTESKLEGNYDEIDGEKIANDSVINDNYLRRLDVVLYKANSGRSIKLDGAVFDVWKTFEENEDMNVIDGTIKDMLADGIIQETNQGTYYYSDPIRMEDGSYWTPDEKGMCVLPPPETEENPDKPKDDPSTPDIDEGATGAGRPVVQNEEGVFIGVNFTGNESDEKYHNGYCYQVYEPNTVKREYLGRYVSGGIYLAYDYEKEVLVNPETGEIIPDDAIDPETGLKPEGEKKMITVPLAGADIEVSSDENFNNIVKVFTTDANGVAKILGLGEGKYYTRLRRPLKEDFKPTIKDEETGEEIIVTPTENDYVPYDELPPCYSEAAKEWYVSKGMIMLPEIKYGHTLCFREIEAPVGYYFDGSDLYITPKSPYGIATMENYRINNAIIIPHDKIKLKFPWYYWIPDTSVIDNG